jgi:ERCC4-type nuclease
VEWLLKLDLSNYNIDKILATAIVLIDTREQENTHIKDYLDKKKIAYIERKLDFGDYGLLLPRNLEQGLANDMVLDFAVERKGSLEEISGNLTNDRDRLETELWRGNGKLAIVIENGSIDRIFSHDYRTQYNPKAFIATLTTFQHRYGVSISFCDKANSGALIYATLYYKLREWFK